MKKQYLKRYVIIGVACCFILISGMCYSCNYKKPDSYISLSEAQEGLEGESEIGPTTIVNSGDTGDTEIPTDDKTLKIYIHICGAVNKPGVYPVNQDSRLVDLVELAGGFSEDAAKDYMNQAQVVEDGTRIYIPTNEEIDEISADQYILANGFTDEESEEDKLININKADENGLMSLPGIGEAKAKSIIEYRDSNGDFKIIEDIMKITGIKNGLFEKIKDKITVK